jgi:hypothetical protein
MMEFASILPEVNDTPLRGKKGMSLLLQPIPFLETNFVCESGVKKELGIELVWRDNSELPPGLTRKLVTEKSGGSNYQR